MSAAPDLVAEAEQWLHDDGADTYRQSRELAVKLMPRLIARLKELEADKARQEGIVRHMRDTGHGGMC